MMLPFEDKDSWQSYNEERRLRDYHDDDKQRTQQDENGNDSSSMISLGNDARILNKMTKEEKKRMKRLKKIRADPGIRINTMHGLMVDAGSSGSRMHVYQFEKRVLNDEREISEAVSGRKLSYPGTDSRWTERLRPGLDSFSTKSDDELLPAIANYLKPLLQFAEAVLDSKQDEWPEFPIYLRATAGMRLLEPNQRIRIMNAVRQVLSNSTYSSFKFEKEYARVISGEEEAIYGWVGVNFVRGSLLKSSEGSGTVLNPNLTNGALEMGGASAQISFWQDNMDIMSNLFKIQIGQGKHWNVYTHSHLTFGINEAWNRMGAFLSTRYSGDNVAGKYVDNPCLPGGTKEVHFESSIYFDDKGNTHWRVDNNNNALIYGTTMRNQNDKGDYDACAGVAYALLNKQYNNWCNFSHRGDCSFSGVYQPQLPNQTSNFGEFIAYSNYFDIFSFIGIPLRSSLRTLEDATRKICAMNETELHAWNDGKVDNDEASKMCFQASYTFQMLRNGYGFQMEDKITAINVIKGQKVGWALGAMLYEINTLPWHYKARDELQLFDTLIPKDDYYFIIAVISICSFGFCLIMSSQVRRQRQFKSRYSSIDDIELEY